MKGRSPELSQVQEQIASRIERMPTLACTVARRGRRTLWEAAPAFDPYDHVHEVRTSEGPTALDEAVDALLGTPLDDMAPRWGVWLIHGYSDSEYVLFYRAHHAAQDGQAMMDALRALFSTEPPASSARAALAVATARRFWKQRIPVRAIAWTLADAVKSLRASLSWSTRHDLSGEARVVSAAVPEAWLRATGRALGASSNDVCLAALAEAVRGWLPTGSIAPGQRGRELYVHLPISTRAPEERFTVGNRLSAVRIPLSFWEESPTARVAAIARAIRPVTTEGMRRVLRAQTGLPEWLVYQIFRRVAAKTEGTLATSGLMRLPGRLAMGEDPIETVVPTTFLDKDLFEMAFLAYKGQVVVSVTFDRAAEEVGNLAALWADAVERLHEDVGLDMSTPATVQAP
ncbi:wax ester/triacylglycerol synthase domain-containing protein [Streptomyces sp. NPDC050848]|uniref:wax ester/triacylglycerol synthase domain-containing protein n=1 Tax=Streptomyces sp. NPDC050848 TaxID=3155791 RepID=UPI00340EBEB7